MQWNDRDGLRSKAAKDTELAPTIGVFQPALALFSPTAVGAAVVGRLFSLLRHADLRRNPCPPAWGKDSASHGLLRSIYLRKPKRNGSGAQGAMGARSKDWRAVRCAAAKEKLEKAPSDEGAVTK